MEKRYDILFEGAVVEGHDPAAVKAELGALFKASGETLEKLFSGAPRMIKRDVDKETAARYRNAMHKVGAIALIRLAGQAPEQSSSSDAGRSPSAGRQEQQPSMADRVAALAGDQSPAPDASSPGQRAGVEASKPADKAVSDSTISLAPAGTAVLREDERRLFEQLDIDTSAIALDEEIDNPTPLPLREQGQPLDTSHISMGDVGETIPHLRQEITRVEPDISGIELSPEGTDFSDCAAAPVAADVPDTSQVSLAEEGSELLEEQYRRKDTAQAPNTDHITLSD